MFDNEEKISDEELAHWLAFDCLEGIGLGSRKILLLFERLQSMRTAWGASPEVLRYAPGFDHDLIGRFVQARKTLDPEVILSKLKASGMEAWPFPDPRYPIALKHIHDPPIVLYVHGKPRESDFVHDVAVVGTRRPTAYGQKLAKETARGLSDAGATIVSGLAIGTDSLAHWGALEGSGRTIAVLGCGPDVCYPSSNRRLFRQILDDDRGIMLSEYFPGTTPEPWRFPARNRIISGLCQSVVVIEGGVQSGSLITAKQAFEQNRDVYAFPGRVDSEMSTGTHKLIADSKAQLVTSYKDVLHYMGWVHAARNKNEVAVVELFGREKEIYDLLTLEPVHFDALCDRTGMSAGELSATLTMLELAGVATRMPGDWYVRYTPGSASSTGS
ncbi:MAG: DNA-processing protein DprA [Candidatus Obscuribacterales bacterium]|nr:DNA-processing protein DprA [Candidatus Obscuribacterales bacterium]